MAWCETVSFSHLLLWQLKVFRSSVVGCNMPLDSYVLDAFRYVVS